MTFVSASEGALWAEVVKDMVNDHQEAGPESSPEEDQPGRSRTCGRFQDDDMAEIAKASAGKKAGSRTGTEKVTRGFKERPEND